MHVKEDISTKTGPMLWLPIHLGHVFLATVLYFIFNSGLYPDKIYQPWKIISGPLVFLLAFVGFIPIRRIRKNGASIRQTPYFLILALLFRRLPGRKCRPRIGTYWRHPRIRWRWALILLKSYFLPLMIGSLCYGIVNISHVWHLVYIFPVAILFLRDCAFLVDSVVATAGYSVESDKWGAPIKAVETSVLAWLCCIACYPPASKITGIFISARFFPQYRLFAENSSIGKAVSIAALFFLIIHVWGIVTQGLCFANLTYRGTTSRGPFSIIRHPQYATKLTSWFFEWLPFFGSPLNILFFFGWVAIYIGRAITEERFLMQFDDYRKYCKQVKWRFVPGLW